MKQVTEDTLAEMAQRLVEAVDPDNLVLFGNRARGDAREDRLLTDDVEILRMQSHSRQRHAERFTWERVLDEYERLLQGWV